MSDKAQTTRPKARLAKGFRDIEARELRGLKRMLRTIEEVFELYGFEPVEQPFLEYTDVLGKFLPDQDRPNEGVFSFRDDDEQWLSLRYDLTAPLARYVAENFDSLPKPYRSYRQGWVFRNEKPGPGRFRQFMQFDADTVGTASPAADAEVCMMAADAMERLGIPRGQYVMNVSNRKLVSGLWEAQGVPTDRQATAMRAIDKLDRLGVDAVRQLLGRGRKDESGDFTKGAELTDKQIAATLTFATATAMSVEVEGVVGGNPVGEEGLRELDDILSVCRAAGFGEDRVRLNSSIIRGLGYYTGPVFEAELLVDSRNEAGELVRFGSVGGGGRYDDLVSRFRGEVVPATGFSIGVSRLYAALDFLGKLDAADADGPVVVLVLDRARLAEYQRYVARLRMAGIRAELYLGTSGLKAQMKYADRRGASLAVIEGDDERARGEIQLKDLAAGARLAGGIESREAWRDARPAQVSVPVAKLEETVRDWFARKPRD
jgi:histidyl-tRNA synthetase